MSSPTASIAVPPAQTSSGNNNSGSGPTSSPLLFFVALGFGVVFTNLWIIVGVKYCFRYNQRSRAARAAADGEPIDLAAMPRPHRRRREKKLMSMDEVNERFPLTKYKAWKSSREDEGLPTAGGINPSAPPSRAGSVKEVEGIVRTSKDEPVSKDRPATAVSDLPASPTSAKQFEHQPLGPIDKDSSGPLDKEVEKKDEKVPELSKVETATSHYSPGKGPADDGGPDGYDTDDDDPIRTALAPEMMGEPGDTCAICLDSLDDDDDVRGLTCGHAFHASCVDPWLTSRRACCPLCKTDYYVPKPRPEGEAADAATSGRRPTVTGLRSPTSPAATWAGARGNPLSRSRVVFISTTRVNSNTGNHGNGLQNVLNRPSRQDRSSVTGATPQSPTAPPTWRSRFTPRNTHIPSLPSFFSRNRGNSAPVNNRPNQPTPAQLEAGNR
jgi:hypothetical protein